MGKGNCGKTQLSIELGVQACQQEPKSNALTTWILLLFPQLALQPVLVFTSASLSIGYSKWGDAARLGLYTFVAPSGQWQNHVINKLYSASFDGFETCLCISYELQIFPGVIHDEKEDKQSIQKYDEKLMENRTKNKFILMQILLGIYIYEGVFRNFMENTYY